MTCAHKAHHPHRPLSVLPFYRVMPLLPSLVVVAYCTSPPNAEHAFQFAMCIWVAGTLGTVAGTLAYPARGPELLSILAEMGASALLN